MINLEANRKVEEVVDLVNLLIDLIRVKSIHKLFLESMELLRKDGDKSKDQTKDIEQIWESKIKISFSCQIGLNQKSKENKKAVINKRGSKHKTQRNLLRVRSTLNLISNLKSLIKDKNKPKNRQEATEDKSNKLNNFPNTKERKWSNPTLQQCHKLP